MIIQLTRQAHGKPPAPLRFEFTRMYNAGYVGRNQEEVKKHIQELAAKGIPGPAHTPTLYPVGCHSLCTSPGIDVYGGETCGEAEYVLFIENDRAIHVGLGSDHTDRFLEKTDIPRSKQVCPNMIGTTVWPLEDIMGHWDEILLKSTAIHEGKEILYQEGKLAAILPPDKLMAFVRERAGASLDNSVIFSGTLSLKTGDFVCGEGFRAELSDLRLERKLELAYSVRPLFSLNPGED